DNVSRSANNSPAGTVNHASGNGTNAIVAKYAAGPAARIHSAASRTPASNSARKTHNATATATAASTPTHPPRVRNTATASPKRDMPASLRSPPDASRCAEKHWPPAAVSDALAPVPPAMPDSDSAIDVVYTWVDGTR